MTARTSSSSGRTSDRRPRNARWLAQSTRAALGRPSLKLSADN
jgi:hypothetical protein